MNYQNTDKVTPSGIITLMTDFGQRDWYVGAVKGVLLARSPGCTLIDITHAIPPGDIRAGAFTLLNSVPYFPRGTIHLAIVDPGVGGGRQALAAQAGGHLFVGPDNGVLGYILAGLAPWRAVAADEDMWALKPTSTTFHGRDLFAPLAAALLNGLELEDLGPPLNHPVLLPFPRPHRLQNGAVQGEIIYADHFGNLVTNLRCEDLDQPDGPFEATVAGMRIEGPRRCYEEVTECQLILLWGSGGYLEISMRSSNAQSALRASIGEPVTLKERRSECP